MNPEKNNNLNNFGIRKSISPSRFLAIDLSTTFLVELIKKNKINLEKRKQRVKASVG
jgi:hypothetical protein